MTQNELKAVYFKFFDMLDEPYKEQAKVNFNYAKAKHKFMPKNCPDAVNYGFVWDKTEQGHTYWYDYIRLLRNKERISIPKPEETEETDEALRDRLKTQLAEVEARIEEKNIIKPGTPVWGWDDNKIMKLFGFYVEKNLSSHVIRRNDDPSSRVDLFEFENVERADITIFTGAQDD